MEVNILSAFPIFFRIFAFFSRRNLGILQHFVSAVMCRNGVPASSDSAPLSFEVSTENTLREKLVGFFFKYTLAQLCSTCSC